MVCKISVVISVYAENHVIFMAYLRLFIEHAGGDIASSLIIGLQTASSTRKGTIAESVCALRIACDVGKSLLHAGIGLDLGKVVVEWLGFRLRNENVTFLCQTIY